MEALIRIYSNLRAQQWFLLDAMNRARDSKELENLTKASHAIEEALKEISIAVFHLSEALGTFGARFEYREFFAGRR